MAFELPDLPYAHDALAAKGMSAETLEYHHDLHHKAYVDNGNKLLQGTGLEDKSLEEVVQAAYKDNLTGLFNNASQHWNHVEPWEVELNDYMGNFSVKLTCSADDPGADDLSFLWEFSDGTIITNDYPNPGGVYPVSITDTVDYSGPATGVTLTVTDDDGGASVTSISF